VLLSNPNRCWCSVVECSVVVPFTCFACYEVLLLWKMPRCWFLHSLPSTLAWACVFPVEFVTLSRCWNFWKHWSVLSADLPEFIFVCWISESLMDLISSSTKKETDRKKGKMKAIRERTTLREKKELWRIEEGRKLMNLGSMVWNA